MSKPLEKKEKLVELSLVGYDAANVVRQPAVCV